jgi:hypothetical protein
MGAVHALWERETDALALARAAVAAAIDHDLYCGAPVNEATVRLRRRS